jgi:hypothetical protein
MTKLAKCGVLATSVLALFAGTASADPVTVDQVLYQTGIADPSLLKGTVDMTFGGGTLTITLTNISSDLAGDGAGILLTGIGFELPTGVSITGGKVIIGVGSTAVNFAGGAGTDVSQEWGFDNSPLNSGVFQSGLPVLSYNTVVGAMTSITTNQFAAGSLDGKPAGLAGPDFGLISALETGSIGSNEAIRNSLVITLALGGTIPSDLLASIEKGHVGLSFGSPNPVPEPLTLSLLLPGLAGLYFARKRLAKVR